MTIKKITFLSIALLAISTLIPSCYYDKEENLYPFAACDTSNVTYSQTVAPIMAANCNACHSGSSPESGITTDSWTGLQTVVLNGKLIPAIEHTGPSQMPKGASKLPDCSISQIKKWVSNGAPNN
jgi:mono/diheme cytochrome c family protein